MGREIEIESGRERGRERGEGREGRREGRSEPEKFNIFVAQTSFTK